VVKFINECNEKKIQVLPPDVNESSLSFTVADGKIRFGLGAVKNVGESAIEIIMQARKDQGPFVSLIDFCQRVDTQKVNRRVLEHLIKSGTFDSIHQNRASVMAALDEALEKGQAMQRDRQSGQMNMFDLLRSRSKPSTGSLPDVPGWDSITTLRFEKESLGFYISGHPLDSYADQISSLCISSSQSIKKKRDGTEVVLCGVIGLVKELITKKGDKMAFLSLEDRDGLVEVVAFAECWSVAKPLLDSDVPLVVIGKVHHDEKGSKVLANRLITIEEAKIKTVESVRIRLAAESLDRDRLVRLRHVLMNHPGETRTFLYISVENKGEAVISLSGKLHVSPTKGFFQEMGLHFGSESTEVIHKICHLEESRNHD
jgi:DNA polymerase-3 subunit alpha